MPHLNRPLVRQDADDVAGREYSRAA